MALIDQVLVLLFDAIGVLQLLLPCVFASEQVLLVQAQFVK